VVNSFYEAFLESFILIAALTSSMVQADLAMVKSGTASFETAMYGIPEVICYATSPMNYYLARFFVRMRHIGMPNIVARKQIAP